MHLILTGATGLVGSAVLEAMIKTKDITKISIISRRPVKMAEDAKDPRINVILHKDFEKYDSELLNQLRGATGCIWALGISQNVVGKEQYVKITKDFPLAAAAAFRSLPSQSPSESQSPDQTTTPTEHSAQPFHFIYISGEGATTTPLSSQSHSLLSRLTTPWYAIIKGQAEVALSQLSSSTPSTTNTNPFILYSLRPGYVDPTSHPSIHPYIPQLSATMNLLACVLGPAIRVGYKKLWSPTESLGKFCVEMAMGGWDETIRRETEGMNVGDDGKEGRGGNRKNGNGFEKLESGGVVIGNGAWRRVAGLG